MKNDIYGLSTSILVHVVLLLLLGMLVAMQSTEPETLGYLEVDIGPFMEGQPVEKGAMVAQATPEIAQETQQEQPDLAIPEDVQPVALPEVHKSIADDLRILPPQTSTTAPAGQTTAVDVGKLRPAPTLTTQLREAPRLGNEPGATTSEPGSSNDEVQAAPFDITGLENRTLIVRPLPVYADRVNAVIKMRIQVDPSGRVTQIIPILKGTPALERAVRDALLQWRFNALSGNSLLVDQEGIVTFRFVLE